MNRKNIGLFFMFLSFLYFVSTVWGGYQMAGLFGAIINAGVLVLFVSGVWFLSATNRKALGLGLMILPFLINVSGIWGGYQMGGIAGSMINAIALIFFLLGVFCLAGSGSRKDISIPNP